MNWEEQHTEVSRTLEELFNDHPEWFAPEDVIKRDDQSHEHPEHDAGSFIVTGALLIIHQRNLEGQEVTGIYNWPPDMGRVQKVGMLQTGVWRLR